MKNIVLLTLKSPRFLYLGLGDGKPGAYEVAERLSFGLWDSLPDKELLEQAAQGRLKVLAVANPQRVSVARLVPTME